MDELEIMQRHECVEAYVRLDNFFLKLATSLFNVYLD
jgi:hypothetical protein